MKKIIYILTLACATLLSGCSGWLDVLPKNEQVTANYWKSKEDVEAMVASGYYYMRGSTRTLVDWGELRGASLYIHTGTLDQFLLENFMLNQTRDLCKWSSMYQVINMANSVIKYAPGVHDIDQTYTEAAMKSHQSEAYFMRALTYFYLVRNFRDVPLVLEPYINDSAPYSIAKSTEAQIIAQIKADIETALNSQAAKEYYESDKWAGASKGRATKWAHYALMADVCLWSGDYDGAITYSDYLINAASPKRPVFMSIPEQWFSIFYPGNSNESIFELNWSNDMQQTSGNLSNYFNLATNSPYKFSPLMGERLYEDSQTALIGKRSERGSYGSYVRVGADNTSDGTYYVWKYVGSDLKDNISAIRPAADANFIIYRMAEIMLIKAEALIRKGPATWPEAVAIMNKIRLRSNLRDLDINISEATELSMLETLLNERDMELCAEGKRWYDLLRFARTYGDDVENNYKADFIEMIVDNNDSTSDSWLRSVLKNRDAWYLPIHQDEIENNPLLVQNPYYSVTN